jgi:hypothetical protein
MRKTFIKRMIDAMLPRRRRGALPKVTACPYCGVSMSQTNHSLHRRNCANQERPPQAAEFDQDAGGGYNRDGTFPQT